MPKEEPNKGYNDKVKALQELLKILSENPSLADRITITLKPGEWTQGEPK